jgi:hypothetical protein
MNKGAENVNVNIPNGLTMNIMLTNTKYLMGGDFYLFARDNNCQSVLIVFFAVK